MCVCGRSDKNKPLLLANSDFIVYLVDALLLDPDHPNASLEADAREWLQTSTAECFAQLALYPPGREALQRDLAVTKALAVVAEFGLGADGRGREFARSALATINGTELESIAEARKLEEEARAALQQHTAAKEQAEARALEEVSLNDGSVRTGVEIDRLRQQAAQAKASGDVEGADAKLQQIEMIELQVAATEADKNWDDDLSKRVEQRSERAPFRPGLLDDAARWTSEEMAANFHAVREDVLGDDTATHTLCFHFTSLFSLDLIMGGHGLRASPYGQLNGGLSVCLADPTELAWEQWSGNGFRERVGRELWGK